VNRQFYEFWGNIFIHAAQGQRQFEEVATWMKAGFTGVDDLNKHFRRCYGLSPGQADDSKDSPTWQKAISDFQQGLSQFAAQWGWVSLSEHQKVLDKCAALEKKNQAQQETITKLNDLLTQEWHDYSELFQHFKDTLKDQSEQFHALVKTIYHSGENEK
jgi:uncharacterized coiled-coil protein SlyX